MPASTRRSDNADPSEPAGKPDHDALNRKIIEILQEDGRVSYSTIAAMTGVSEGAVRKRVNRLQQSGALRIVAVIDPLELSYDAYTMLGIKVAAGSQPEAVAERLSQNPDVVYAIWISGPYDLLVEVIFERKADFVDFLSSDIYGHSDISGLRCHAEPEGDQEQLLSETGFPKRTKDGGALGRRDRIGRSHLGRLPQAAEGIARRGL